MVALEKQGNQRNIGLWRASQFRCMMSCLFYSLDTIRSQPAVKCGRPAIHKRKSDWSARLGDETLLGLGEGDS